MQNFQDSFRSLANNCIRRFIQKDRGKVRQSNDRTHDSQANFFLLVQKPQDLTQFFHGPR